MTVLLVFLGAGIGGVARYGAGRVFAPYSTAFPWGTLLVNISGSLLITILAGALGTKAPSPQWNAFLIAGLCGGYTTFAAFSVETLSQIQSGQWGRALAYAATSVVACVLAAWLGLRLSGSAVAPAP